MRWDLLSEALKPMERVHLIKLFKLGAKRLKLLGESHCWGRGQERAVSPHAKR